MHSIKSLFQQSERIAYCQGASNYTWVHLQDGKKELVSQTISRLEVHLPGFIRVHKRTLVNPHCIKSAHQLPGKKGAGEIQLETGEVFPVSRRRWADLDPYLSGLTIGADAPAPVTITQVSLPEPPVLSSKPLAPFILLVTDDAQKMDHAQQLIDQKWAGYYLQTISSHRSIGTLQSTLSTSDSPTLILLDAQAQQGERMKLLGLLKETGQLRHIPVILFVPPTDQSVIEGYQYQANSVVAIPKSALVFEQHLARILHFWLKVAALPLAQVVPQNRSIRSDFPFS